MDFIGNMYFYIFKIAFEGFNQNLLVLYQYVGRLLSLL